MNENDIQNNWYANSAEADRERVREIPADDIIDWADLENKKKIEKAFKDRGTTLKSTLRDETRLHLKHDDENRRVAIKVCDWMPERIVTIVRETIRDEMAWLEENAANLSAAANLIDQLRSKNFDPLKHLSQASDGSARVDMEKTDAEVHIITDEHLRMSSSFMKWLTSKWLPENRRSLIDPITHLFLTGRGVLGRYYPYERVIHIYWPVIVFCSRRLGLTVEDLACKVLIHEYAHALTHIGFDIDGNDWDTEPFVRSETSVIEGLAQYYTASVCDRLDGKYPGVKAAYEAIWPKQPDPYRVHVEEWELPDREAVRQSMLHARMSDKPENHDSFVERLKTANKVFGEKE
jgi:hypothetical protein